MTPEVTYVVVIIMVALIFDFINGFHDSANSIATADRFRGDTARLGRSLAIAEQMIAAGGARFPVTEWRELVRTERSAGYPAVHHSTAYAEAYRPAYRVVAGSLIP